MENITGDPLVPMFDLNDENISNLINIYYNLSFEIFFS